MGPGYSRGGVAGASVNQAYCGSEAKLSAGRPMSRVEQIYSTQNNINQHLSNIRERLTKIRCTLLGEYSIPSCKEGACSPERNGGLGLIQDSQEGSLAILNEIEMELEEIYNSVVG